MESLKQKQSKGFRELILKSCIDSQQATELLVTAKKVLPTKAYARCVRAYNRKWSA